MEKQESFLGRKRITVKNRGSGSPKLCDECLPSSYGTMFRNRENDEHFLEGRGNNEGSRGIKWKAWDKQCVPKKYGGQGFKKLRDFNTAMLGKQA